MTNAEEGISRLKENIDTLIVIPNQKVMEIVNDKATLLDAFKIADSVLNKGTKAIAELITTPGLINLDFADIKSIMSNAGSALMGVGEAEGDNRSRNAVIAAIDSPLVEVNIEGARGVLINICGGTDLTMAEIEESAKTITEHTAPDANIIFGASIDNSLKNKVKITVIATGFDERPKLFQSAKKIIQPENPSSKQSSLIDENNEENTSVSTDKIKNIIDENDLPQGVNIVDEFDIPAFLRKNK
jgi:cell division protein FtsZ